MTTQTVTILNDFGSGSLERRTRTSSSGKTSDRWSVTLDAKPIALDFDTKTLGRGLADTIADHLRRRGANIGAAPSTSTQLSPKYAANAFARGEPSAIRRYSGGKTGATPPNQSPRLFNDSGRFARGIAVGPTRDNNWVINVPANRLNATYLGSENALRDIVNRLRQHVPEFGSAADLVKVPEVRHAIDTAASDIRRERRQRAVRDFTKELTKVTLEEIAKSEEP
jgi:hypothetical protein